MTNVRFCTKCAWRTPHDKQGRCLVCSPPEPDPPPDAEQVNLLSEDEPWTT